MPKRKDPEDPSPSDRIEHEVLSDRVLLCSLLLDSLQRCPSGPAIGDDLTRVIWPYLCPMISHYEPCPQGDRRQRKLELVEAPYERIELYKLPGEPRLYLRFFSDGMLPVTSGFYSAWLALVNTSSFEG